jgi:hypothetical protein
MTPASFISYMRFYLRVPQLKKLGDGKANAHGDEEELCLACNKTMDLHGNHANGGDCRACLAARAARHNGLKWAVHYHAGLAGCTALIEPATHLLLLNQFSPQQCRVLFAKNPTKDFRTKSVDLYRELQAIAALPLNAEDRSRRTREADLQLQVLLADKSAKQGRRMDVQIIDPHTGDEVWVDPTCTHTTGATKLAAERKETKRRLEMEDAKEAAATPSAAVKAANKKKLETYALMLSIAEQQVAKGLRSKAPQFYPAVVSTHGEFCEGLLGLQEWLTNKYRARIEREGHRDDGSKANDLTARFRNSFRSSMLLAVAKGQADMLLASGLPTFQKTSADADSKARRMAMRLDGLGLTARGRRRPPDPESDDEMPLTHNHHVTRATRVCH